MPLQTLTRELAEQIAADFPALQSLNLARNALRDVRHLQWLPHSLAQLDLSNNGLATLPDDLGLWLPRLTLLRVRGNKLESLRALVHCTLLQSLDAGANRVALVSELRFLQSLTRLRHLQLDGNPLVSTSSSGYRREVLAMLPQLQSLDGQEFTAAERLYAKLQLKTHVVLSTGSDVDVSSCHSDQLGSSSHPSPTRLLTPASLQSQSSNRQETAGNAQSPLSTSCRRVSAANEQVEAMTQWEDDGGHPGSGVLKRPAVRIESPGNRTAAETRETLLKNRVAALEAILKLQDDTIQHALTRFGANTAVGTSSNSELSLTAPNDSKKAAITAETAATVYTRLLAVWREKCVMLMVQMRSTELVDERRREEIRRQQTQMEEVIARCKEQSELWRQRAVDLEAQRDLEAVAARQEVEKRSRADAKALQAVRSVAIEREKLQRLAKGVVVFTGGVMREKAEQLRGGAARLAAMESRLLCAKERVETAATLVTHREARVRNSEAAMEAERRMWAHQLQQKHRVQTGEVQEKSTDAGKTSQPATDGKVLRPATETALRALFHRLDAYNTGLVRTSALLQALRLGDSGVLRAVGGPKKLAKLVTHVETAVHRLSLGGGGRATLTWGEFLLFFIPESSVSLSLEDDEASPEMPITGCTLCSAVGDETVPTWSLISAESDGKEPEQSQEGGCEPGKSRQERRKLQALSAAELVQQVLTLRSDRDELRRRVLQDAHELRDRVLDVRREWEAKTDELVRQKDLLQRTLDEHDASLLAMQHRCEEAEKARDEAQIDVRRLREELTTAQQEASQREHKLATEADDRVRREQELWQTELQDMRLAHTLLKTDHAKQQTHVRQLERELARQKETLLAHESERVASLEDKVRRRDTELTKLRRERNSLLSSLREQERKLAQQVVTPPTENIATQTERGEAPLERRTVACQTVVMSTTEGRRRAYECEEAPGMRMSLDEIATPAVHDQPVQPKPIVVNPSHLSPEAMNLRLQKLQSLTEDLLAD